VHVNGPIEKDGHYSGRTFETFAWAAGLAAMTKQIAVLSTVHVPVHHPVLTAKLASTIDHISRGRFGLNIVCGWYKPEMEMFGRDISAHDDRYSAADEWVTLSSAGIDGLLLMWMDYCGGLRNFGVAPS
jgi:FMNH2-dependent dimethyl sulfone monooxygenase